MTKDTHNRDADVDRLLAAAMARRTAEPAGACLDADILAAWADNALKGGDLAAAEAHAADCARCQAILAAIVKATPEATASPWGLTNLRWLVPLAAAAAAGVVWIVLPLREAVPVNVRQVSQIAESTLPPPTATEPPDGDALSAARAAGSRSRREPEAREQSKDLESDQKTGAAPAANADAPSRADARLEKFRTAAEAAAGAPAAPPPAAAAKAFSFGAPETVIVSSNPASRWRLLPGGAVQRSADGGATWQIQNTGVSGTLLAGASPSPSVCWLVGAGGVVLLSADGRSWTRVAFPEAVQLVAVRATDDQTATVTTSDGRELTTEDGGRTWMRAPG